jgi:hypothetical protein
VLLGGWVCGGSIRRCWVGCILRKSSLRGR